MYRNLLIIYGDSLSSINRTHFGRPANSIVDWDSRYQVEVYQFLFWVDRDTNIMVTLIIMPSLGIAVANQDWKQIDDAYTIGGICDRFFDGGKTCVIGWEFFLFHCMHDQQHNWLWQHFIMSHSQFLKYGNAYIHTVLSLLLKNSPEGSAPAVCLSMGSGQDTFARGDSSASNEVAFRFMGWNNTMRKHIKNAW